MKELIAVYGSGKIGSCEATLTTGNGYPTIVMDNSPTALARCVETVSQNWDDLIAEGLASLANKNAAMKLLTTTSDPDCLRECSFVFEAVSESLQTKRAVYRQFEQSCRADAILASCTSSMDAETLAALLTRPERFVIAHPFQPVHMLPLVEVVCHGGTSPETLQRTKCLLDSLQRQVVVLKKSVPGFLVNRFAQALFRESIYLIEQGVTTAEDVDRAIKYAVGMRYASIGLLEYFDAVGFELESTIAQNVYPTLCKESGLQKLVQNGLETGRTGQGSGRGLYDWATIDEPDFRRRMQQPYFNGVLQWNMPK
ncbi:MAG: 3-hydroxyacyl-CoA dehydrogenase family protein [Oscillospiraceae bacterium]|nr:3-hydroxyacyl-CoA dehydrogenase family protein [Oscillospiraceae bacterium]